MKVPRKELIDFIKTKVFRTSETSSIDKIEEELTGFGKFTVLEFKNIKVNIFPLDELEDAELYWIIESASKYLSIVNPVEFYFDPAEIQRYKLYERHNEMKMQYPLVFKDVVQLAENQYAFPCSIQDIMKLKYNNIIEVHPELQREGKQDKYGYIKVATNARRVRELTSLYENNEYSYNSIRFNLMDDGSSGMRFDEVSRELIIERGSIIIPDGNHRTLAAELVNPNTSCMDRRFIVLFTFFNKSRVKQTISQEWNVQPVNKQKVSSMKNSNANNIVDIIKRNPDADPIYVKKIVSTGKEIQNNDGFILYSILSKAIETYYHTGTIETQDERLEIADWLTKFLNRLTSILLNDFKKYETVKQTRWSVDPYAFVGYIMISKYLEGQDTWKDKLKKIIDSINFDIEESPMKNRTVKNNMKNIEIFFEEVIKNG